MGLIQELRVEELKRLSNLGVLAEFVERFWDEKWRSAEEAVQILVADNLPFKAHTSSWGATQLGRENTAGDVVEIVPQRDGVQRVEGGTEGISF